MNIRFLCACGRSNSLSVRRNKIFLDKWVLAKFNTKRENSLIVDLPELFVDQSMLTAKQFESLTSYTRIVLGETRYREAASKRSAGAVSVGSYYRTVQQARGNVRASIVTLLIGLWVGVIKVEDLRRLFELVGIGANQFSDADRERFLEVLEALLDKIVL